MGTQNDDHDKTLGFLEEVEAAFRRMISGIFRFVIIKLPTWFYERLQDFFDWIIRFLRYALRFLIRLGRLLFFAAVWGLLVFGPLALTSYKFLGACWAVVGIGGSVFGLQRWWRVRYADGQSTAVLPGVISVHVKLLSNILSLSMLLILIAVSAYFVARLIWYVFPRLYSPDVPDPTHWRSG